MESRLAQRVLPKTVWNRPAHRSGEFGSTLLKRFVPGTEFPFPKSLYAVEDALRIAIGNKVDAVALDFFAGSGATGHALRDYSPASNAGARPVHPAMFIGVQFPRTIFSPSMDSMRIRASPTLWMQAAFSAG